MSEVMKLKLTCKCGGTFECEHRFESYIKERADRWHEVHRDCQDKVVAPAIEFTHADQYSAGYQDGLKASDKIMMQLFTDPENQPTQHGTVTVEYMEAELQSEREAIIDIVAFHGGSVEIEAAIRARGVNG